MATSPCPVCNGTRLRPEARSVKVGGTEIYKVTGMSVAQALDWVSPPEPKRPPADHRPQDPQGDRGAAGLFGQRGAGLPDPGPDLRDSFRRRGPAHPAGHPDRLGPGGGALHSGRAIHRAPPKGQPAAFWTPSSGCGTWATRSSWWSTTRTPSSPPTTWWTWAPGPGNTAGRWSSLRPVRGYPGLGDLPDRAVSFRQGRDPHPPKTAPAQGRAGPERGRPEQPQGGGGGLSPWAT